MDKKNYDSKTYKVLLIEDDFVDQESVRRILSNSELDFEITTRTSLQSGVEILRQVDFNVVLLDLTLPDSYGIDTVGRMLEEFSNVPLIVHTGSEDDLLAREAIKLGVEDYLVKGKVLGSEIIDAVTTAVTCSKESANANAELVEKEAITGLFSSFFGR